MGRSLVECMWGHGLKRVNMNASGGSCKGVKCVCNHLDFVRSDLLPYSPQCLPHLGGTVAAGFLSCMPRFGNLKRG
jgi:hypothetical protein